MRRLFVISFCLFFLFENAQAAPAKRESIAKAPYVSALSVNAETGEVLFEDNADARVYPASVLKLMVLYIVQTRIEAGKLALSDMVQITKEAADMGGSQVYLDVKEQFSVEDLLYALMVQSANDAATALAIHVAGSRQAFVALMNETARELGMSHTTFHSEHGLPPGKAQQPDVSTAWDLAILCRELVKRPETLKYTSADTRGFRNGEFTMRNHNKLLGRASGVDGLKTGYFALAGFSIAVTAPQNGQRVITLVMGSENRKERDAKALELLQSALAKLPPKAATKIETRPTPAPPPAETARTKDKQPLASAAVPVKPQAEMPAHSSGWGKFFLGFGLGLFALLALILGLGRWMKSRKDAGQYLRGRL